MSWIEIYSFNANGDADKIVKVRNSWRSGPAVWDIMEKRYLPPYRPNWLLSHQRLEDLTWKPTRFSALDNNVMQEIWDLFENKEVSRNERICLGTTFDKVVVKKEDFQEVIEAFRSFGGETSLPEQTDVLEKLMEDPNCIAVAWNQTSVSDCIWDGQYDEEKDEHYPYNLNERNDHWFLFNDEEMES